MYRRLTGSIAATIIATFCVAFAAAGGPAAAATLENGGTGSIELTRGDLAAAGLPDVEEGSVTWRDFDNDGDQDFALLGVDGSSYVTRVYRNDGNGFFSAIAACVTSGDSTICEGDQSAGVKIPPGSTPIKVWVRNLTADVAPAEGVSGIDVARNAGARIDIQFLGGGHAIITQGDGAHGIVGTSTGSNGGNGADDWGIFWAVGGNGAAGGNGGKVNITSDGAISTDGAGAHGLVAESQGGNGGRGGDATFASIYSEGGDGGMGGRGGDVTVTNQGSIATHGDGSHGIVALSQGGDGGNGGNAAAIGGAVGGNGGHGGIGGWASVTNSGGITTEGIEAHGILAQSLGGVGGSGGAGGGIYGAGGGASGSGASFNATISNSGSVLTAGAGSNGIFAQAIGGFGAGGGASGGVVSFGGLGATGGNSYLARIDNSGRIITLGDGANALFTQSIGGGGGSGAGSGGVVSLGGQGSAGGNSGPSKIYNSGQLETQGSFANGIYAQSIGGGGGDGAGSGGLVSIGGGGSSTGHAGEVIVENSGGVKTTGEESHAILAQSIGGGGGSGAGSGGMVSIGGSGNAGGNGSDVTVKNSGTLVTTGLEAAAILAQSVGGGGGNGGGSGGIASFGGRGSVTSDGGSVSVMNSGAITTGSGADTSGAGSQAIFAQSVGGGGGNGGSSGGWFSIGGSGGGGGDASVVRVQNTGSLQTRDNNSSAIFAQSVGGGGGNGGGSGASSGMSFSVAIGGSGSRGGAGDTVSVSTDGGSVSTEGDNSHGILAQSVGGGGGNGGFAIAGSTVASPVKVAVGGNGGPGGSGGIVTVQSGTDIATSGADANGIVAQSVGGGGGTGGFAITGSYGGGVNYSVALGGSGGIGGSGSAVTVGSVTDPLHGAITTMGDRSYGILAQSIGGGGGSGGFTVSASLLGFSSVNLGLGGKGGTGGHGDAVSVVSNADILTGGENAHGILAQSLGGGGGAGGWSLAGGATAFGGASISLGGAGGSGAKGGGVDVMNEGGIETSGDFSRGIMAQSIGGGGGTGGMGGSAMLNFASAIPMPKEIPVTVSTNIAIGIGGSGGTGGTADSVVVTNDGAIVTHGEFSQGILAQSIGGGGGAGGKSVAATVNVGIPTGPPSPEIKVDFALAIGGSGGSGNDGGAVDVASAGRIDTEGDGSHAIMAQSIGGGGGSGGSARSMTVGLDPSELTGAYNPLEMSKTVDIAIGGQGGSAGNGANVNVENTGTITTRGADAYGIMAQSIGGGGGTGGGGFHGLDLSALGVPDHLIPDFGNSGFDLLQEANIAVGGQGGSSGSGANVGIRNSGTVRTLGDGSFGILAQSIGGGGGIGGVGARGDGVIGIGGRGGSAGDGGTVEVESNGTLETFGTAAHAILAQSIGGGGGIAGNADKGLVELGINMLFGYNGSSSGDGGTVAVNGTGDIVTHGDGSNGIFAQSVGGGGGIRGDLGPGLGFSGSVGGNGSGGGVSVGFEGSINTYGDVAHGIVAQSAGGSTDPGTADRSDRGSAVSVVVEGDVLTHGADSHGILAQSVGGDGNGNITVDIRDGIVQGGTGSGVGVLFRDGAQNVLTNHGSITTLSGIGGTAILGTGGSEFIDNFGSVTGSIDLGGGSNAFRNQIGGVFESGATVDLGVGGVLTNDGTLSPGGAGNVQTTTLGCDFVQTETGTFELTVSGNDLDRLIVADGSITLDGTLKVVADHDAFHDGTTYDIIEGADGQGITGSFSDVILPETAFLSFDTEYLENSIRVSVDVENFSTAATNPVEGAISAYLDSCLPDASGDMSHLIGMFQIASADQVSEAFASLSPDTYDNLTRAELQSVRLHEDALAQRMSTVRSSAWIESESPVKMSFGEGGGLWMTGARQSADQDPAAGYLAHNFTTSEAMGGYERTFGDGLLGGSIGTTRADVDRDNDMAKGKANSVVGSVYGGRLWGGTFVQGILTYANNSFENRRDVHVAALERVARSEHDGHSFSGLITGGNRFDAGRWVLEPFTSLRYLRLSEKGFSETGAGSANLIVEPRTTDWLGSDLGMRMGTRFVGAGSAFLPELLLGWTHDFGIDDREIVAAFEGDPSMSFTLDGQDVKRDGAMLGAGLTYYTAGGWKATVRYDRGQRGDFASNGFSIRLGSNF